MVKMTLLSILEKSPDGRLKEEVGSWGSTDRKQLLPFPFANSVRLYSPSMPASGTSQTSSDAFWLFPRKLQGQYLQ